MAFKLANKQEIADIKAAPAITVDRNLLPKADQSPAARSFDDPASTSGLARRVSDSSPQRVSAGQRPLSLDEYVKSQIYYVQEGKLRGLPMLQAENFPITYANGKEIAVVRPQLNAKSGETLTAHAKELLQYNQELLKMIRTDGIGNSEGVGDRLRKESATVEQYLIKLKGYADQRLQQAQETRRSPQVERDYQQPDRRPEPPARRGGGPTDVVGGIVGGILGEAFKGVTREAGRASKREIRKATRNIFDFD